MHRGLFALKLLETLLVVYVDVLIRGLLSIRLLNLLALLLVMVHHYLFFKVLCNFEILHFLQFVNTQPPRGKLMILFEWIVVYLCVLQEEILVHLSH